MQFEKPGEARFATEFADGAEWIVIPAARNWFVLLFLPLWLIGWTIGGVAAVGFLFSGEGGAFMAVWLIIWALGWVVAAAVLGWQAAGAELLGVRGGALEVRWRMWRAGGGRRYELGRIRGLSPNAAPALFGHMQSGYPPFLPFTRGNAMGAVRFNYGARTVYAGSGLSFAEGEMIVDRLRLRLPASSFVS